MFARLEGSSIALWVGESLWVYPVLLSLHIIGLAIVVGIFSMRDLRLIGLFPGLQPTAFLPLSKMAWAGFIVNALSGILLFSSQAVTFVSSTPFLLKIGAIILGMAITGIIQSRLRGELAVDHTGTSISNSTRLIAVTSLLCWTAAIIAGRLVAYI